MPRLAAFPKAFMDALCIDGSMTLRAWIDLAADKLDIDGLEFYAGFLELQSQSFWPEARRLAEDRGLAIPMLCCSPDFTHPDPAFRQRQIDQEKHWIDLAAALGCRFCRVLSGQRRPEVSRADGLRYAAECIEACLPHASAAGIALVLENHYKDNYWQYPEFAQKTDVFCELMDLVIAQASVAAAVSAAICSPSPRTRGEGRGEGLSQDASPSSGGTGASPVRPSPSPGTSGEGRGEGLSAARCPLPAFGVNFDPSNTLLAGEDPLELLRRIKHHVLTMHASDRYLAEGTLEDLRREEDSLGYARRLRHGEIGKGLNDYDAIFSELAGVGFDGWISIEDGTEGIDQLARSAGFLRRKIARHWPGSTR